MIISETKYTRYNGLELVKGHQKFVIDFGTPLTMTTDERNFWRAYFNKNIWQKYLNQEKQHGSK